MINITLLSCDNINSFQLSVKMMFAMPQEILTKIYSYDDTYTNHFKDNVRRSIWEASWKKWKEDFLNSEKFAGFPRVNKKFEFALNYVLKHWGISEEFDMWDTCKRVDYPTEITMTSNWDFMTYNNGVMETSGTEIIDDVIDDDLNLSIEIRLNNKTFSAQVMEHTQYKTTFDSDENFYDFMTNPDPFATVKITVAADEEQGFYLVQEM